MMNELKSCPFCGNNDIELKQYYNDGWYWFVTCKNCKAEKIHQFKGVAIQEWNTRPAEEDLKKEFERLKVALKDMCELWESMGKQIPPLLNEQKYLNAKALTGEDTDVPTNAPDKNADTMEGE